AAIAFIRQLAALRPCWRVVVTCGTEDARRITRALAPRVPAIEAVVLLPWDRARPVAGWLDALSPDAVVVVEPEIWPNLYAACGECGVPLLLVNAHMYPSDLRRYRLVRRFIRRTLQIPTWIGVQTERDRAAFVELGAPSDHVVVAGNLKFDAAVQ